MGSPPSRAAWIEILSAYLLPFRHVSPPSRAAWIEIISAKPEWHEDIVAAFTGGVD